MTRGLVLAALVVAAPQPARADAGDHWCRLNFSWSARTYIPVWVHPQLAANLYHLDGTAWTSSEVQTEIELVIQRLQDQAPSAMPPIRYMGLEPANTAWNGPTPAGQWGISIRPKLGAVNGYGQCGAEMVATPASAGKRVYIGPSTACELRYAHWLYPSNNTNHVLGGLVGHELMHALGFHHEETCQEDTPPCQDNPGEPQTCGLMTSHGLTSEYADTEFSDWDALATVYGGWENDGDFRKESPLSTLWITMGANAIASGPIWASSHPATSSSFIPVTATDPATLAPHLYRWNYSTQAFGDIGVPPGAGPQLGALATAHGGGFYHLWYMRRQSVTSAQKGVQHARYTSSTPTHQGSPLATVWAGRQGVGGTFDPKSGQIVTAFRDSDQGPVFAAATIGMVPATPGTIVKLGGAANQAVYTPAVACGTADLTYNCIAVWAGAAADGSGEAFHYLKWIHFGVSAGAIVFDPAGTSSQGYVLYGAPTVVYQGPSSAADAFVIAFGQPPNYFYTLSKSPAATSWSNLRSHVTSSTSHLGPPLLGATPNNIVEAWTKLNRED